MMSGKAYKKILLMIEILPLIAAVPTTVYADAEQAPAPAAPPAAAAQTAAPAAAPATAQTAPVAVVAKVAPVTPPSSTPSPAAPSGPNDMTVEQANKAFSGFRMDVVHQDTQDDSTPIRNVSLHGMVPKDCVDKFEFATSISDINLTSLDFEGFNIRDLGGGLQCVADFHKAQGMCRAQSCVSISSLPNTQMDLAGFNGQKKLGLITYNSATDTVEHKPIGKEVLFRGQDIIDAEQAAKAEAAREARVAREEDLFKNCRHSLEELSVARSALNRLAQDTQMAFETLSSKRKELDAVREDLLKKKLAAEKKSLLNKIAKVKTPEEAEELSEELSQFADDHPEFAAAMKTAQKQLIDQIANNMDDTKESFAARKAILGNLMGMDGVTAAEAKQYKVQMNGLDIAQQASLLRNMDLSTMNWGGFYQSYNMLMQTSFKDYQSACASTRGNAVTGGCTDAMRNMTAVQMLPNLAQQSYVSQVQSQMNAQRQMMQMQQQMQQSMSGIMNVGVMNAAGQNGFGTTNGTMSLTAGR